MKESKVEEFVKLKLGGMTMKEYGIKFTQPSLYAPQMVGMRAIMRKFVLGLGKHVKKEWKATLLINDMDISRLMVYAQKFEEDK